jgi:hypothetical protein
MKGQNQVLSIVLVAGIIIAMMGLAYAWGMPLIQKRTTITEFSSAEGFILNLNSKITGIANSGSGEVTLEIPNGNLRAIGYGDADPKNNTIIMEFVTEQSMVINASTVLLKTTSFQEVGVYGESEPRIISLTGERFGTGNKMRISLHYRELDTNNRGYKIALDPVTSSGNKKVKVSFIRNEVVEGGAKNGGDLILTHVNIELM